MTDAAAVRIPRVHKGLRARALLSDGRCVVLREAGRGDVRPYLEFRRAEVAGAPDAGTAQPETDDAPGWVAAMLGGCRSSLNHLVLLALSADGQVAGLLELHGDPGSQYCHKGELSLLVGAAFRGRGLGRLLLRTAQGWVEGSGAFQKLYLRVRDGNDRARHLYLSAGFSVEGRETRAAWVGDHFEDEWWLGWTPAGAVSPRPEGSAP